MTLHQFASLASGVVMGLWLDRLVPTDRGIIMILPAMVGLGLCLAFGQEWAGIALGCLLGARVCADRRSEG
jgi:hypothetical protein